MLARVLCSDYVVNSLKLVLAINGKLGIHNILYSTIGSSGSWSVPSGLTPAVYTLRVIYSLQQ